MFELQGKYSKAIVYSDDYDDKAVGQILKLCNQDFTKDAQIRVMSDYHFGAGCTIGFTADLGDKVVPNLVGVDIGCGMLTISLGKDPINLETFDKTVHKNIPHGFMGHDQKVVDFESLKKVKCLNQFNKTHVFEKQIGSLGGGNHFIELDKDDEDNIFLVIHSGSRNLGKMVADFYQDLAIEENKGLGNLSKKRLEAIERLKKEGKTHLIEETLSQLLKKFESTDTKYPKDLCFLTGEKRKDYLHDMGICQQYASLNRRTMASILVQSMFQKDLKSFSQLETVHNYINFSDNIIRKGAVSARKGERLLIPINMRDGSLICVGKGNPEWNYSAPHGAGRVMSRSEAKKSLDISEFAETMKDVYSTTVSQATLDEAPMAYKSMESIIANIGDTVEVQKIIRPIYNFKSS